MKTTLKSLFAIAALGVAAFSQAAMLPSSGSIVLTDTTFDGGNSTLNIGGGEFQANVAGQPTFYTFCMEVAELVMFDTELDYTLSDRTDSQGDRLSKGTAYLYEAFVKGSLYARTLDMAHQEMAGYLQAAIWILEDENPDGFVQNAGKAKFFNLATNPYIAKVVAAYGSLANAKTDDSKGKVKVMNLTYNGVGKQDVLVYVPDSGATLALLGLGMVGIAFVRRNRKQ